MSDTAPQSSPALWLAWNSTHTAIRFWTADPLVAAQQASTGLVLTPFYSAGQMREARSAASVDPAKWCPIHQHYKPCEHPAPQPSADMEPTP
jgi:hypothetical protein